MGVGAKRNGISAHIGGGESVVENACRMAGAGATEGQAEGGTLLEDLAALVVVDQLALDCKTCRIFLMREGLFVQLGKRVVVDLRAGLFCRGRVVFGNQ